MATVTLSVVLTYETKPDAPVDDALYLLTVNTWELLKLCGIETGRQAAEAKTPLFCPPPLQNLVELVDVKHFMVVGPGDENTEGRV